MKKFKQILFSLCLVCCLAILVACDQEETSITEIYIDPNSITVEIEQYSTWSTDDIVVMAKYNDGIEKAVSDVTFSYIDTQEVGEQTLIATYKNFTCQITITITEFDGERDYYITKIATPISINNYNTYSKTLNTYTDQLTHNEKNSVKGFSLLNEMYKVGDDNEFKFSPAISVSYFDEDKDPEEINNYPIHADVYLYDTDLEEFVLIPSNNLDDYVSINPNQHTFDFTDSTVGKIFKIAVRPDFSLIIGEDRYTSDDSTVIDSSKNTFKSIEFTFEVVDGWNVYTARDISVIDNSNDGEKWTEIKTANSSLGLEDLTSVDTNGVILHNDIIITKNDIPSCHFYSGNNMQGLQDNDFKQVDGYMIQKDHYTKLGTVYKRVIADGDTFTIEGNYFTIDISNKNEDDEKGLSNQATFPHVKKANVAADNAIVISTTLFSFIDANTENEERGLNDKKQKDINIGFADSNEETCSINNISLIGNSNKDEEIVGQAGIVCYKTENVNFTMTNCLSQAWYICHFFEGSTKTADNAVQTLKYCNSFDAYSSIIHAQGARDLRLEDCVLIGAGGPVIICDEEVFYVNGKKNQSNDAYAKNIDYTYSYSFDGKNSTTESIKIDERLTFTTNVKTKNCILQSWVVGTEQWFTAFKASSVVGNITALNPLFAKANLSNLSILDPVSNAKLNIVAVHKSAESHDISTPIQINGTFYDDSHTYGLNFENANLGSALYGLQSFNGTFLQLSATGLAGAYMIDNSGATPTQSITNMGAATDYLALYLKIGIGAVIGLSNSLVP